MSGPLAMEGMYGTEPARDPLRTTGPSILRYLCSGIGP